jgi:hypothetical protein
MSLRKMRSSLLRELEIGCDSVPRWKGERTKWPHMAAVLGDKSTRWGSPAKVAHPSAVGGMWAGAG